MIISTRSFVSAVSAALMFWTMPSAAAQRRPAAQEKPTVAVETSLQAGGSRIASSAAGRCEHAAIGSIYNVPSEMWRVEQNSNTGGSVTLTLWAPKDGSARMFTLAISNGNATDTVQVIKSQPAQGSGSVTLEPAGKGGTFTIDAKSAKGTAIAGTIKCSAFTPAIAEGGN